MAVKSSGCCPARSSPQCPAPGMPARLAALMTGSGWQCELTACRRQRSWPNQRAKANRCTWFQAMARNDAQPKDADLSTTAKGRKFQLAARKRSPAVNGRSSASRRSDSRVQRVKEAQRPPASSGRQSPSFGGISRSTARPEWRQPSDAAGHPAPMNDSSRPGWKSHTYPKKLTFDFGGSTCRLQCADGPAENPVSDITRRWRRAAF